MIEFFLRNRKSNLLHLLHLLQHQIFLIMNLFYGAILKNFGVGLIFETTPETYSKLLQSICNRYINLIYPFFYSVYMDIKNNPYYWSHILRFVRHRVTAPSFSVRKYVYFVHTILTVYLTILHSFFERQLKEVRRLRRALRRARTASGLINYLIYLTV